MNRTFKVVFNRARACLVVANEITRAIQKKGAKSVLVATVLASGLVLFPASYAHAGKTGGSDNIPFSGDYGNTVSLTGNNVEITNEETIEGSVYGAYTTTNPAEVSNNSVTVSSSTVEKGIYGGYDKDSGSRNATAEANDNSVTVNSSTVNGGISFDICGGYSSVLVYSSENVTATANGNSVVVSGSTVTTTIFGGRAYANGSENVTAAANGNSVTVSDSSVARIIYGGYASAYDSENTTANNNSVTISNGSTVSSAIYGGKTEVTAYGSENTSAMASGNSVIVSNGSRVTGDTYGGYAKDSGSGNTTATANGNSVTVSGSGTQVTGSIYGGHAEAKGSENAIANNNTVTVSNGSTVNGNIYGGHVDAWSGTQNAEYANNNTVTIDSATVQSGKTIVGGVVNVDSASHTHTATGNTINLTGAYSIDGTSLYGGYNASSNSVGSNDNLFTGNTLNLDVRKKEDATGIVTTTVNKVANFETINIQAGDISSGTTILSTTSTTLGNGTTGTTVNLVSVGSNSDLSANDTITLISGAAADGKLTNDGQSQFVPKEGSFADGYNAQISLTNGSVIATVLGATANPETKVLNEARVASQAFINSGTDLLLDTNIEGGAFGAIRGGHSRYKTGSSAEIDGVNLVAGLAHTFAGKSGDTTGGVFFEAGWGDTTTHNTIGGKSLKGSGDTHYYGAGLLARYEQKEGAAKGLYADAAFRVGRLSNDYHNNDARNLSGERVSFDIGSTYYAAHVGVGYKWDLTNSLRLDTSAQYMWSHVDSKNVAILGDSYHFDSMNSHRTRVGVKLDYTGAKNYTPYIGLAWEHEFKGEAKASVQGNAVDKADLGGSSGIVTLGVDFKPSENSPFIFNAGFVGHFGEHKGAAGQLMMQYKF